MGEIRILVVGSSVLDTVVRVEKFPNPGESVRASRVETFMGGKGSNQAVAAARLGAEVAFAGAVGNDSAGHELIQRLRSEMIDCQGVMVLDGESSGHAFITLNAAGQNTITVSLGANMAYQPESSFRVAHESLHHILLLQGEIPIETSKAAAEASQGLVIFNPAPPLVVPQSMYPLVDYITPNEHEAMALTSIPVGNLQSAYEAGEAFLDRGCRNVIITLGARGAVFLNTETRGFVEAPSVDVVDTVGAGDCFNGAFAVAIAHGASIENATRFAVECASISVTQLGATSGMPYVYELPETVREFLQTQQSV
jgi:ribokinase